MSKMEKQFVKDLNFKDKVQSIFLAKNKAVLKDKNGNPFICLSLKDKTGALTGMIWDQVEEFDKSFDSGDLVSIKGHVQNYQEKRQIVIHHIKKVQFEEHDMSDFIDSSVVNPELMWVELQNIVSDVSDPNIRQVLESLLKKTDVKEKLLKFPAAKSIHHAKVGGLLEHIVSICKIMYFLGQHYSFLDRDLLIFGAIYHDIGKLWELDIENGYQYTTRGRLIGHMAIACELLDQEAQAILGFPVGLKDKLKHIILSHHGRLEFGSPKRPKFLEALVVAMVDDFDSKVASMYEFILEDSEADEWTKFSKNFERYLFKG